MDACTSDQTHFEQLVLTFGNKMRFFAIKINSNIQVFLDVAITETSNKKSRKKAEVQYLFASDQTQTYPDTYQACVTMSNLPTDPDCIKTKINELQIVLNVPETV
jgi:hypothetical protein